MNKSIYLAGPITGTVYKEGNAWRVAVREELAKHGIEAYSPMRGKSRFFDDDEEFSRQDYESHPMTSTHGITIRDFADVRSHDLVLANFKGVKDRVSIGSCLEIGAAHALNKPIVAVMEDGDIHKHGMVEEISIVLPTIDEALYYIKNYFLPNYNE